MEEILLAREIQLHLDVDHESGHLPRLQRKLGKGFFQVPAQEVAIQFFYNDSGSGDRDGRTKAACDLPIRAENPDAAPRAKEKANHLKHDRSKYQENSRLMGVARQ